MTTRLLMQSYDGPSLYDQETVFQQYVQHRAKLDSLNQVIETPIIAELNGVPQGLDCLDMARLLLAGGLGCYPGIDPSARMIERARRQLSHPAIRFARGQAETMEWEMAQFDLVLARLVFHYVKDISNIFSSLRPRNNASSGVWDYLTVKKPWWMIFTLPCFSLFS